MKKSKYSISTFLQNEIKLTCIKEDTRHYIFQRLIFFFFLVLKKVFQVDVNVFTFINLYL